MSTITIKTPEEIKKLREGGKILAKVLRELEGAARPGVKTHELEDLAQKLIKEAGAKPSFLGYGEPPYSAALCTSVNEEVVHCIPSNREIKEGDLIGLDCGIWYKELCTDMAVTIPIGKVSAEVKKLIKVTRKALDIAINQIKPGNTIGDLGSAVQKYVEKNNFSVIRKLVGHGVGYQVHEPPRIPNFGEPGEGEILKEGMVLAIEPMVNVGSHDIEVRDNKWDIVTKDKSLSAHFEYTVVVTKNGCEILTK
ncbi:type I methionyl aminopeptidase [Patescibacteria group bacterium]|nr:type I methionyl aminopeptidase [Patescibacteria group bacterium]